MTRRTAAWLRIGAVPAAALWVCAAAFSSRAAAQPRPLPPVESFVAEVRANLARSDREQYRYAYRERRSEVHANPFGRLGTGGTLLYEVEPGEEYRVYYRQLVEKNGKRVDDEERQRVDRRHRNETNPAVDDVVNTLEFHMDRRETVGGRDFIVVTFAPRKDAKPKTRQGKLAKAFKGDIWIDEQAREVARVEATAVDDISYGLGVLARLHEGATARVERAAVDGDLWLPTSVRLVGTGRAILVRKLNIDYVMEWFDYRRVLEAEPAAAPPSSGGR